MIVKYTFKEADVEKLDMPNAHPGCYGMKRFVAGEVDEFRSGFGKFTKERSKVDPDDPLNGFRPMYIDEFYYTISGKGRLSFYSPPDYSKKEVYELVPGDIIFMSKGSMRLHECLSDEPWIIVYVGIPASSHMINYKIFPGSSGWPR